MPQHALFIMVSEETFNKVNVFNCVEEAEALYLIFNTKSGHWIHHQRTCIKYGANLICVVLQRIVIL
jgi:hypothetical protein